MCALIYQTAWLRQFRLIFGASTFASAAVLAIFMGGLGLGSALLGKRADAKARPLGFYGNLELLIAAAAAASPLLMWLAAKIYFSLGGSLSMGIVGATIVRLILATFVIGFAAVLMGGTLPAAARAVETNSDSGRGAVALLYGINTMGAVAGALLSTFFLLEQYGTRKTLYLAVLVNVLVAIAARAQSRTMEDVPVTTAAEAVEIAAPAGEEVPKRLVYFAAAAVGFVFLLMELVWYRMLSPLLGGTTFMFGLILALALVGIALGGLAYSFWGGRRIATAGVFALTCSIEAALLILPFVLGDRIALITLLMRSLGALGFGGHVLSWIAIAGFTIVPAAFVSGVQFPILIALLGRGRENVGREVGTAYAWNTGGAIAGSLAGGFGLLPLLSAPGAWRLAAAMLAAVGLFAAVRALRDQQNGTAAVAVVVALAALAGSLATGPTAFWRHGGIGAGRAPLPAGTNRYREFQNLINRSIVWDADGRESSVAVSATDDVAFVVNGKSDGSARGDAGTQVMSGMIGATLHPNPRKALVIGLGTGSTAGWLGRVPGMERVDVVELEPVITEYARLCAPVSADALRNPIVKLSYGDAREALLASGEMYDLVASEPSNPYRAGVASLFTKDFYEATSARLRPGGMLMQWMQLYEIDAITMRTIYATVQSVFPYVETWSTGPGDVILLATREPIEHDADRVRARLRQPGFGLPAHLAWRVESAEGFYSHLVGSDDLARRLATGVTALNTDDQTLIEYGFARAINNRQTQAPDSSEIWSAGRQLNAAYPKRVRGMLDRQLIDANRGTFRESFVDTPQRLFVEDVNAGRFQNAVARWRANRWQPVNSLELASLAFVLAESGSPAAETYVVSLAAVQPIEADVILARLRLRQKRYAEATDLLVRGFTAYRKNVWPRTDIMKQGLFTMQEVAVADRASAVKLYQVTADPHPIGMLSDTRSAVHVNIGNVVDPCGREMIETMLEFEPYPIWNGPALSLRADCYRRAGVPLAAKAASDVKEYYAAEPSPLIPGAPRAPAGSP
jgi:spermidine synthase